MNPLEAEDMSGNITTKQITVIVDNTVPARPALLPPSRTDQR
jgi:hypothetical protein